MWQVCIQPKSQNDPSRKKYQKIRECTHTILAVAKITQKHKNGLTQKNVYHVSWGTTVVCLLGTENEDIN